MTYTLFGTEVKTLGGRAVGESFVMFFDKQRPRRVWTVEHKNAAGIPWIATDGQDGYAINLLAATLDA